MDKVRKRILGPDVNERLVAGDATKQQLMCTVLSLLAMTVGGPLYPKFAQLCLMYTISCDNLIIRHRHISMSMVHVYLHDLLKSCSLHTI